MLDTIRTQQAERDKELCHFIEILMIISQNNVHHINSSAETSVTAENNNS